MGLFNFILGCSRKEQEEPIRDKLKNRKHFEKVLEERSIIQERYEIISKKEKKGDSIGTYLYYAIAHNNMNIIGVKYSMGGDIKNLQNIYINSLNYFLLGFENDNPIYNEILNRVSLGILLNIPDENFNQLVDYVQRMDELAKPADWTPDLLLWFMLDSRLREDDKRTYAKKLAFPKLYKGLYKVTQAENGEESPKALKEYIGKWYNLNKDAPWYNNHLKKNCYRGYWAWEVAAVAKIMHIDDTTLKDNPYYPYDMVHWEDAQEQP